MQKIKTIDELDRPSSNRTLSLDALRSFVAICETGSFRNAAGRVHRSPSAVSLQISKLESLLGERLFERDARNVTVTRQGETLLEQARHILVLNDKTLAMFQKRHLIGSLSLAAPHDLGVSLVPTLLKRLAEIHPGVQVNVRLGKSEDTRNRITDGSANLALFNDVGPSTFPSRELFSEPLKWLVLKNGRAVQQDPFPLAVAEEGCAWRDAALNALQMAGKAYRIAYSSDTSMGQIAAIRADLAIAALPQSLADRELIEAASHYDLPELPLTHIRVADDGSELAKALVDLVVKDMQIYPLEGVK